MQYSGHTKETRYDVYRSAKKAYENQIEREQNEDIPFYRPKTWKREERKREKLKKMKSWYKNNGNESVIFVPCTPEEKLKKAYEEEIKKSRFKIKIVEKSGKKLKDTLHKKDPFKSEKCGKIDCFVCTKNGIGNCRKKNVTYTIRCMEQCDKKRHILR